VVLAKEKYGIRGRDSGRAARQFHSVHGAKPDERLEVGNSWVRKGAVVRSSDS